MTKVLVTGGNGFLGKTVVELLRKKGYHVDSIDKEYCNFLEEAANINIHTQISKVIKQKQPDTIIHLAGVVGGILKNTQQPYDMLYQNLAMNTTFLEVARKCGIKRLIYTFCGCSFPSEAQNPIKEESLFTGLPDHNAMFYSLGKAVNHLQVVACRRQWGYDWSSVIPGNAYGPNDNFSEKDSHVIPGLIRRFHQAKAYEIEEVTCWGDGSPIRDFIHVDDVARGIVLALEKHHEEIPINISSGKGVSIKEVTEIVKKVVGYKGNIEWDTRMPNGHNKKVFDISRQEKILGFKPKISLEEGIKKTYDWYQKALVEGKVRL